MRPPCLPPGRLPARRRAFTLLEVIAAMLLLGTAFTVVGKVLVSSHRRARAADERRVALELAGNAMTRLVAQRWEAITGDDPRAVLTEAAISGDAAAVLKGHRVDVSVSPGATPDVRRVVVEVRWKDDHGVEVRPARLVTWVHRRGRAR